MIVFGLLSSVFDILTFITLRPGFHASATLFVAVSSPNRPSPNSPSRSSCAPAGPSAAQGKTAPELAILSPSPLNEPTPHGRADSAFRISLCGRA
jgi:hypothetical protein